MLSTLFTDSYKAVWAACGLISYSSPPPASVSRETLWRIALVGLRVTLLPKIRDIHNAQMGAVYVGVLCHVVLLVDKD